MIPVKSVANIAWVCEGVSSPDATGRTSRNGSLKEGRSARQPLDCRHRQLLGM